MKKLRHLSEMVLKLCLFTILFYVFTLLSCVVKNYPILQVAFFIGFTYLIYVFVKIFNRDMNDIDRSTFIGNKSVNHITGSIYGIFLAGTFFIGTLILFVFLYKYELVYQNTNKIIGDSIGYVFVALYEELVFRAFVFISLYVIFRKYFISVIISSVLFAVLHFNFDPIILANITLSGIALCFIYTWFKSIAAPIFLHFAHNFVCTLFILPTVQNQHWIKIETVVILLFVICWYIFAPDKKYSKDPLGLTII